MSISGKTSEPSAEQGPTLCNCQALRQATRRVTQFYDHALASTGIRITQLPILYRLGRNGPTTMKALAEAMIMDRATLGHNLRPLEAQGLVTRAIGKDRRERLVTLTPLGADRLTEARRAWKDAQARFEGVFGSGESEALRATLARIATLRLDDPAVGARVE